MERIKNIFGDNPVIAGEEFIEEILSTGRFKLERIISNSSSSPENFWYDQDRDEFILLLSGSAALRFEDGNLMELKAGDFLTIHAHQKHRVERTDPAQKTFWLALHY
jgi:cupin 2 domain-containing protein